MPINESSQKIKPRLREGLGFWDMTPDQIKQEQKYSGEIMEQPGVFDYNNPPKVKYEHQAFPKMVYLHKNGEVLVVQDENELKAAKTKGFVDEPSPKFDYSNVVHGKALLKNAKAKKSQGMIDVDEEEVA